MSARKAPTLSLDDKMDVVFQALANGAKLTKKELIERTEMSAAQVEQGWRGLRGQPDGHMWVVEPHREHTLYYAATEFEPMLRYQLWQARRNYKAAVSLQVSIKQQAMAMESIRHGNGLVSVTVTAMQAATSAVWSSADIVRRIGVELGIATETVESWLAVPSHNGS